MSHASGTFGGGAGGCCGGGGEHGEGGGGGRGNGEGGGGEGHGLRHGPQSTQSVQRPHAAYSDPGPPSSHSLSELYKQVSSQTVAARGKGDGGGGGEMLTLHPARGPQSEQSVQRGHNMIPDPGFTSAPAPPSSQSPSPLQLQLFVHDGGGDRGGDRGSGGGTADLGGEHCPMTASAAKMTRSIAFARSSSYRYSSVHAV